MGRTVQNMNTLVLANSASPAYGEARDHVLPYLEHLGVPYDLVDLAREALPANAEGYALTLIAHRRLEAAGVEAPRSQLLAGAAGGMGLVSLDPALPAASEVVTGGIRVASAAVVARAESIEIGSPGHYVTARHPAGEVIRLAGRWRVPTLVAAHDEVLAWAGERPLLAASRVGQGRAVRWAGAGWMRTHVLGPLAGLDDLFWRSLVWAARKPFALRGLPPLVTMRVDDVAGRGTLWGESPLYWVRAANRHGLRPWLGLFIYNLTPPAVSELRDLITQGRATAFPHAFGRPPRPGRKPLEHYDEHALPCRAADYDEFIYFDHHHRRPWTDDEAARGLQAVDEWYARQAPLPMSPYALAHWSEVASNTVPHLQDRWGVDLVGAMMQTDLPLADETPWLIAGPFRRHEAPGTAFFDPERRGDRPVYYADTIDYGGRRFFTSLTEIRDVAGYEWAPDQDVAGTVERGVRQLRRALDSMALAVLFTHETDHIFKIPPERWAAELEQVAAGIAEYAPLYVTLEEGVRYVRATRTSRLVAGRYDTATKQVLATLTGQADGPTHFWLFTEARGEIEGRLVEVPAFEGEVVVRAEAELRAGRQC